MMRGIRGGKVNSDKSMSNTGADGAGCCCR